MLFLFLIRKRLLGDSGRLGSWGEKYANRFLKGKGHKLLALNYCAHGGEIDIVTMSPSGAVVFTEVKTRSGEYKRLAREAVNAGKRRKIKQVSGAFLKAYKMNGFAVRYDVITVLLPRRGKPKLNHYKSAF